MNQLKSFVLFPKDACVNHNNILFFNTELVLLLFNMLLGSFMFCPSYIYIVQWTTYLETKTMTGFINIALIIELKLNCFPLTHETASL